MGLVTKQQSIQDRRVYYVSLTQKGKDILNGDREVYSRVTGSISSFCKTEQEQQFVENLFDTLIKELSERGQEK